MDLRSSIIIDAQTELLNFFSKDENEVTEEQRREAVKAGINLIVSAIVSLHTIANELGALRGKLP